MKKLLGAVFAAALVLIPALSLAQTYETPYLSCMSTYPMVSLGNAGRFHVVTNLNGPFIWMAPDEGYSVFNTGSQFVTPFTHLGRQEVTVAWGTSGRASCQVDVVAAPGYGEPYVAPVFNNDNYNAGYGPNVTLSSVAYPLLPNTGFEPQTLAAFAFAVVLLLGTAIALYPHAKKAFTIVTR